MAVLLVRELVAVAELDAVLASPASTTEKALALFAWGTRTQLFWDGNKRTSLVAANKLMLMHGVGMLTITEKHMERFNELLLTFYGTGEAEPLTDFLYETAIQGLEL